MLIPWRRRKQLLKCWKVYTDKYEASADQDRLDMAVIKTLDVPQTLTIFSAIQLNESAVAETE